MDVSAARSSVVAALDQLDRPVPGRDGESVATLGLTHDDVPFDEGVVDTMICGDWPRIAHELGLGPPPPPRRSLLDDLEWPDDPAPPHAPRPKTKTDKAARKRQRQARKKNRRK